MIGYINWSEVSKRINLSDGLVIVLLDRLGMEPRYGRQECARNIFLVDSSGQIIWQVESQFDSDGGPFTNVLNEDEDIKAYRWDGGMYRIDVSSGHAIPISLVK